MGLRLRAARQRLCRVRVRLAHLETRACRTDAFVRRPGHVLTTAPASDTTHITVFVVVALALISPWARDLHVWGFFFSVILVSSFGLFCVSTVRRNGKEKKEQTPRTMPVKKNTQTHKPKKKKKEKRQRKREEKGTFGSDAAADLFAKRSAGTMRCTGRSHSTFCWTSLPLGMRRDEMTRVHEPQQSSVVHGVFVAWPDGVSVATAEGSESPAFVQQSRW